MKGFRVELKVCEGCGALWLRAAGDGNYCRRCALRLVEFPAPQMQFRRGRPRKDKAVTAAVGGAR